MGRGEFKVLLQQLEEVPFSTEGAIMALQTARITLDHPSFMMEYFPGVTLKHPQVASYLNDNQETLMTQFGRLVALDCLLNNYDRTNFLWSHEGNANNLLFLEQGKFLGAIDQTVASIENTEGRESYLTSLAAAVTAAADPIAFRPYSMKVMGGAGGRW